MQSILKSKDVADLLGLSIDAVQQRAALGEIPGAWRTRGDHGHWRFSSDQVQDYIEALKARSPAPAKRRGRRDHSRANDPIANARKRIRQTIKESRL